MFAWHSCIGSASAAAHMGGEVLLVNGREREPERSMAVHKRVGQRIAPLGRIACLRQVEAMGGFFKLSR